MRIDNRIDRVHTRDMTTTRTAPAALAAYRTISSTAAKAKGMRVSTITVDSLAEYLPTDGTATTVWEGFGHVNGRYLLGLSVMAIRDGSIVCLSRETGGVVSAYPLGQGRTLETLIR